MGTATITPAHAVEAGSWQSFELIYRAGRFGIDDTGSIKIAMRFATDFGPVQFAQPEAPGYTTVSASNGAELDYRWEFKRNIRPWSRSLYIGVKKHFLSEGDTITVRFGDQSRGSKGIRAQTYCESAFEFRVFVDPFATYDYVALPNSPQIAIAPGPPVKWRAILPTLRKVGETFRFSLKAEDAWGNPSDRISETLTLRPSQPIGGLPKEAQFEPGQFALEFENLTIMEPNDVTVQVRDQSGNVLCRSNALVIQEAPELRHYWGDLHGQSNETLGTNTAREYFLFGRDKAFLDVCAHQGNDFQINGDFWITLNALTAELNEPGRFIAFPGYEWSANTAVGGDRNVFYRREGRPLYRSSHAQVADQRDEANDAYTAHELFEKLRHEDCVCWAHCGGRYADITYAHDARLEAAVEVHSSWGTFEWLLHDAFSKDYRIGVVCNSDGHKGRVGASFPGASFFGAYGGLTCYLAPALTRDAIFEAMRRRHHYGTTGARIFLRVGIRSNEPATLYERDPSTCEHPPSESRQHLIMGDIAQVRGTHVDLTVDVIGSAPIEKIDIFDGPNLVSTHRAYCADDLGNRLRLSYSGAECRGRARTTNWDGVIDLEGSTIESARMFNNWNLDRGIQEQTPNSLRWKAVTTGNYGGLDLWINNPNAGQLRVNTHHAEIELEIADVGFEEMVFPAGGLKRQLTLHRLPQALVQHRMQITERLPLRGSGDTRPYVRVQQIDGHRAWSSPSYLFRGS